MIGGIYCEAGLGPIYSEKTLMSVKQKFNKLVGLGEIVPKGDTLNEQIINHFYNKISRKMGRVLSSWSYPSNRGYNNRTVDLTRSICMGIYHRGRLKRMYRFTGGSSEESPTGKERHPDPASRAKKFLEEYDLINKNDFSVVIAATMPYAVRLEKDVWASVVGKDGKTYYGYDMPVLSLIINRLMADIYDFKESDRGIFYGYIFETGGRFEA